MSDEDYYHRIRNLVGGLISRTETDDETIRLQWEAVADDVYELSLSRTSIRISSQDFDGRYPFLLTILDEHGMEIEQVLSDNGRVDDYRLRDLYMAASRSHRRVGERLTEVFEELGIPDPPPSRNPFDVRGEKKSFQFREDEEPPF